MNTIRDVSVSSALWKRRPGRMDDRAGNLNASFIREIKGRVDGTRVECATTHGVG